MVSCTFMNVHDMCVKNTIIVDQYRKSMKVLSVNQYIYIYTSSPNHIFQHVSRCPTYFFPRTWYDSPDAVTFTSLSRASTEDPLSDSKLYRQRGLGVGGLSQGSGPCLEMFLKPQQQATGTGMILKDYVSFVFLRFLFCHQLLT